LIFSNSLAGDFCIAHGFSPVKNPYR